VPKVAPLPASIPDVLKALSDEMRWSIVTQMAEVEQLACTRLEHTLPVSKPTISYHIKVLYHAGLIEIHKEGRNYFYRLRRDVLDSVLHGVARQLGSDGATAQPSTNGSRSGRSSRAATGASARGSGRAVAGGSTRAARPTGTARAARSG
jgi:DNA-binding transcriptional ArsR family regulator